MYSPFCITQGITIDDEKRIFMTINRQQKRLNVTHLLRLQEQLSTEDDLWDKDRGAWLVKKLSEDKTSPFYKQVFKGGKRAKGEIYLIRQKSPLGAPYILTNAHRRRALIRVNARELYHISRLREDSHAQWDINNISRAMSEAAKKVMPLSFALIGGKDKYSQIYENIFGKPPKVIESMLPVERKIK